jgi:Fe/S biogenesis protein NfuA
MDRPNRLQIEQFIEEDVNPGLAMHGGFLAINDYDEESGALRVTMGGGCHGCASSTVTLKRMITHALQENFPGITSVEDATDHAAGQSPYY